ncbi:MAG: LysR family transcriptional regulator, partial [Myxococcales bacterium]|nr:LysR family transcriptional regulator [Myxococcales bacterium]
TISATGGRAGGGAALTDFGRELIARFRAMEAESGAATRCGLRFLRSQYRSDD